MSATAAVLTNDEYEEKKKFLDDIRALSKSELEELYRILKKSRAEFSENSNGVFFDLCKLPDEVFSEMKKFMEFCHKTRDDEAQREDIPATLAGGWAPTPLEPPGPVSLYLWNTNPEFRGGTPAVRRTILRDAILNVTERADAELRGIKWQRKKILEQVAAQQTAAVSPPMDTHELDAGLCALFGYQKVSVDEANKKVRFFPADPRTWSPELPVWGATAGSRAVLHAKGESSVGVGLAKWLGEREREGWKIDWPEAEGTLEDIKSKMTQRNAGLGPRLDKPKKADWAAALGRAEAIAALGKF